MENPPTIPPNIPAMNLFHNLFYAMEDGLAIHRVVRDASGKVVDTEIMAVNPAWKRIMGVNADVPIIGCRLSEFNPLRPLSGPSLFDLYDQAANTGQSLSAEVLQEHGNRFHWMILTPIAPEYVTAIYHETTLLKIAEQTRQSIIDAVSDAVFVYEAHSGLLLDLNRRALELVGYPRTALLGQAAIPGEPVEFSSARGAFLQRALAGETEMQLLTPVSTPDGEKWYDLRARSERIQDQIHVVFLIHDVTEIQRQVRALEASEARYRAVSESISDYAYLISIDAQEHCALEWITEAFTTLTGCSEAEAKAQIKHNIQEFYARYIYPDDLAGVLNAWWRMIEKGSVEFAFRLITRDGGVKWMRTYNRAVPLPNGQGFQIFGAAKDISDRIEAESMYLSIFNAVNDSIFVHDIETGRIVDLNIRAGMLLGYPRDEIIEKLRLPHETYEAARHRASLIHRAALGEIFDDESPYVTPDGQTRWVESHFKVAMIAGKQRVVCVARDITERKLDLEALARSEERNRTVSELISDFAFQVRVGENGRLALDWITDAYSRLTGYTSADLQAAFEQDDIQTTASRFVYADDIWKITRDLWSKRMSQQLVSEFRIMRKNRTPVWVRAYIKPIQEGKRLTGFSGAVQDISGLMQAERNYRALFEASIDAILILDVKEGNVIDANQKGDALLIDSWSGNPEKILVDAIFQHVTREDFLAMLHAAAEGTAVEQVWEVKMSSRRPAARYEVRMRPVDMGGERRVLAVFRDVSDYAARPSVITTHPPA